MKKYLVIILILVLGCGLFTQPQFYFVIPEKKVIIELWGFYGPATVKNSYYMNIYSDRGLESYDSLGKINLVNKFYVMGRYKGGLNDSPDVFFTTYKKASDERYNKDKDYVVVGERELF
jgi:hypothetical protein